MYKYLLIFLIMFKSLFAASYLPPSQVFQVEAKQYDQTSLLINFKIAPGYSIYKDKIHFSALSKNFKIGNVSFPDGIIEQDNVIGKVELYNNQVYIIVPIEAVKGNSVNLGIDYQGCQGLNYCYPAIKNSQIVELSNKTKKIQNTQPLKSSGLNALNSNQSTVKQTYSVPTISTSDSLKNFITGSNSAGINNFLSNNLWIVILGFFLLGILLAFTPCIFPMLPILFSIITGNKSNFKRSIILSTSYILGIAISYAAIGTIVAVFGKNLQLVFQNNITNYILGTLFIIFSLSMFGLFEIKLPSVIQTKLSFWQKNSSMGLVSVFIMGAVSTLILSPCVTAPLAGAILYIVSTGNVLFGASALFSMGLGSGLPLLIIAVLGNQILPKNGSWMLIIKDIIAIIILALAVYIITRSFNLSYQLMAVGGLLIIIGTFYIIKYISKLAKIFAIVLIILGSVISTNQFTKQFSNIEATKLNFIKVTHTNQLNIALEDAKLNHQKVILDFAADWCLACKEMEATTLSDKQVINLMKKFKLIRVDMTNSSNDIAGLKTIYQVFAPPTLVFIDNNGKQQITQNIIGYISAKDLIKILEKQVN